MYDTLVPNIAELRNQNDDFVNGKKYTAIKMAYGISVSPPNKRDLLTQHLYFFTIHSPTSSWASEFFRALLVVARTATPTSSSNSNYSAMVTSPEILNVADS
jgi:hypothetical protein